MSFAKGIVRNVSWLAVAQFGRRALSLLSTAVLARLLLPDDFGLVSMAVTTLGLFAVLSEIGVSTALVQRLAVTDEQLSTAFWLNLGATLCIGGVAVLLRHPLALGYHEPRVAPLVAVLSLVLPINGLAAVSDAILQRNLDFKKIAIVDLASNVSAAAVGIALAVTGAGAWALIAQQLTTAAVSSVGRIVAAGWLPRLRIQWTAARQLSGFGAGVVGVSMINYATRNIDNALVGAVLGARMLGYYAMAYNLVLLPGASIGGIANRLIFPMLSSLQNDTQRFREVYRRALRMLSIVSLPLVIGLCAVAPLFIDAVYGPAWRPVVPLMRILVVIGAFEAINTSGAIFYATGRPFQLMALASVSLLCMTLAFAIGVRFGVEGVAWSYVAVSPIVFMAPHLLGNARIGLRLGAVCRSLYPALLAALLMGGLIVYGLSVGLLDGFASWQALSVSVLFGALVYVAVLHTTHVLDRGERDLPWSWVTEGDSPVGGKG